MELFNDDNFLVTENFLPKNENWQKEFRYDEGVAGLAFRTRTTQHIPDVQNSPKFTTAAGSVPIRGIICVPIILDEKHDPLGVASFHNSTLDNPFDEKKISFIEVYADTLGIVLKSITIIESSPRPERIFIVHGRDRRAVNDLELELRRRGVQPLLLFLQPRTGGTIIEMLEGISSQCSAGFVLITPDDEGRLAGSGEELQPRARENVIFESGLLVAWFRDERRVCFLVKRPVRLPSDLGGVFYQEFDEIAGCILQIEAVLTEWKIDWKPRGVSP
ncbi:MAG: nucleotide-binding protein [Deltaproteobacteria bacterium]|nr:nucleotide-binding protein [Deltaproteobacteria bacterium]